jgi:hypothetical protein
MMANMDFFKALGQFDRIQMKYLIKPICEALPIAIRAGHTCVGSRFSGLIARMTLFFVPSEIRLRNHVHTEQKGISLVNKLREYGMSCPFQSPWEGPSSSMERHSFKADLLLNWQEVNRDAVMYFRCLGNRCVI